MKKEWFDKQQFRARFPQYDEFVAALPKHCYISYNEDFKALEIELSMHIVQMVSLETIPMEQGTRYYFGRHVREDILFKMKRALGGE